MKIKKVALLVSIVIFMFMIVSIGGLSFLHYGQKEVNNTTLDGVNLNVVEDGIYIGEFNGYRWSNQVEVEVKNHKIVDIRSIDDQLFNNEDVKIKMFKEVKEEQSINVDTVSGATITSKAYLKAIENSINLEEE